MIIYFEDKDGTRVKIKESFYKNKIDVHVESDLILEPDFVLVGSFSIDMFKTVYDKEISTNTELQDFLNKIGDTKNG